MRSTDTQTHGHGAVESVTDHVHHNSWSANLEKPHHAVDSNLVIEQAIDAIEHTAPGNHLNLVTHGAHDHPKSYLYDALEEVSNHTLRWEYIKQCGCGGHVTRVYVD